MRHFPFLPCLLLALAVVVPLRGTSVRNGPVEASLISEVTSIQPGHPFEIALRLRMDAGWHTYGREPGDAGQPTAIEWDLPGGFTAGPLQWPRDSEFTTGTIVSRGYEREVMLLTTITPPAALREGATVAIRAHATWLACSDQCMPGEADLVLELPASEATPGTDAATTALFAKARRAIAIAPSSATPALLGLIVPAFIGGLILNLMPCVFPVLGIKIMGFVHQSGADRRKVTTHGLIFTAGVLLSFWLLAGVLLALRAGGEHLGWGFQLQSPAFVFALSAFLLVFGLNMSGVFEFGLAATGVGSSLHARTGYAGSFFTGVLVTVVSTPCAAPFLAPALGAALAMPPAQSFVLFTVIAAGLSLPYLILSCFPALVKLLPRPGAWMESFKQLMAFPLHGTVAFLVWVLAGQLDADALFSALLGLVLVALATWAYGRWGQQGAVVVRRHIGMALAAAALAGGLFLGMPRTTAGGISWQAWSPALVDDLRAHGRIVYVDFTARWCATCKVNKLAVFSSDAVTGAFVRFGVAAVRADWTNRDPAITAALARYGRSAVPFNLIYGPGLREPIVLPEVLTPEVVLDALARASDRADGGLVIR